MAEKDKEPVSKGLGQKAPLEQPATSPGGTSGACCRYTRLELRGTDRHRDGDQRGRQVLACDRNKGLGLCSNCNVESLGPQYKG